MKTIIKFFSLIKIIWREIDSPLRVKFYFVLLLIVITSLTEIVSVGSVIPFLGVLSNAESILSNDLAKPFIEFLNVKSTDELILFVTLLFCAAILLANSMRILLLWFSTRLSFAIGSDISFKVYSNTLHQSYDVHIARNSSELIDAISVKTTIIINNIIIPVLNLISSTVMLCTFLIMLIIVNPEITFIAIFVLVGLYSFVVYVTKNKVSFYGASIASESTNLIRAIQEGLGGIRDILIDGTQGVFCKIYRDADVKLRHAQSNNIFIAQSPRYFIETFGMFSIVLAGYYLSKETGGIKNTIPILGAMALGAQRLLPICQQLYSGWSNIASGMASLDVVVKLLKQPQPCFPISISNDTKFTFEHNIELSHIEFSYLKNDCSILTDVNLIINKGERIGFIGETGSGKSTLLDIIMGLLVPTRGHVIVDNVCLDKSNISRWQKTIAHVPQVIFLADSSIEENIAFGVPKEEINFHRVRLAANKANIADFIESLPLKYGTVIGERGVRLSGGQRQRLGIARAMYKQCDVIVFDEATSALDNQTELSIISSVENLSLDVTVIMVAHRLTTLKNCTKIIKLSNGKISAIGNYSDLIIKSEVNHER